MIGAIARQLFSLFVDDVLLATTILCVVGVISVLAFFGAAPAWLVGLLLTLALPTALVASVLRSARRESRRG